MALLVQHNFNSNWRHADGAGDNSMKMEIVSTEIAKLINKHPKDLIKYLNGCGDKVKPDISAADLIKKVVLAIQEEPRFAAVLAHLIRGKKVPEKFFGGDGDNNNSGTDWSAIFNSAAQIISTIGELTAAQKAAKARKEAAAKAAKDKAEREAKAARDRAEKELRDKANGLGGNVGMTTQMKWIIGGSIGATLAIGTVIAVVWYNKTH